MRGYRHGGRREYFIRLLIIRLGHADSNQSAWFAQVCASHSPGLSKLVNCARAISETPEAAQFTIVCDGGYRWTAESSPSSERLELSRGDKEQTVLDAPHTEERLRKILEFFGGS